jgi:hypothetical protein
MILCLKKSFHMVIGHKTLTLKWVNRIMRPFYLLLISLVSTFSCSHIPKIYLTEYTDSDHIPEKCHSIFPDGDWRFVHSIEVALSGGNNAFMLGVTRISPQNQTIWAVMMTLEGMVLFDAFYDGRMVINRAIPPFDSEFFAQGLMEDIRLIFFQPEKIAVEIGLSGTGESICRYHSPEEIITDVVIGQNNSLTINRYHRNLLHRTVRLYRGETQRHPSIFQRLELIAHKPVKFEMDLNLLETEPLTE